MKFFREYYCKYWPVLLAMFFLAVADYKVHMIWKNNASFSLMQGAIFFVAGIFGSLTLFGVEKLAQRNSKKRMKEMERQQELIFRQLREQKNGQSGGVGEDG